MPQAPININGKNFTNQTDTNIIGEFRVNGELSGPSASSSNTAAFATNSAVGTTIALASNLIQTPAEATILGFTAAADGYTLDGLGDDPTEGGLFYGRARYFVKLPSGSDDAVQFNIAKKDLDDNIVQANTLQYTSTVSTSGVVIDLLGIMDVGIGETIGVSVVLDSGTNNVIFTNGDFKVGELSSIG